MPKHTLDENETIITPGVIKDTVFRYLAWVLIIILLLLALSIAARALAAPDMISVTLYPGESFRYAWEWSGVTNKARITVPYCDVISCLVTVYQETSGITSEYWISGVREETRSVPLLAYLSGYGAMYVASSTKGEVLETYLPLIIRD